MANEWYLPITDYLKGDYGFLTVLVILIIAVWIFLTWKKKHDALKREKQNQAFVDTQNYPGATASNPAPQFQQVLPQNPRPQPMQQQPIQQMQPMRPQPAPMTSYVPPISTEETLFEFEEHVDSTMRTLSNIEKDATNLLKKKTEDIEVSLIAEKQAIEKKLEELAKTEQGIKELVQQLRVNYYQVKRQQKTYELMKRSLLSGIKVM